MRKTTKTITITSLQLEIRIRGPAHRRQGAHNTSKKTKTENVEQQMKDPFPRDLIYVWWW
jgi:t-SNARE complex subunit (syntaxin)